MGASIVMPDTANIYYFLGMRRRSRYAVLLVLGSTLGGVLGCGSDTTGPAPLASTAAFWALRLNQHAVNLAVVAPYDTIQLRATALTVAGTPLPGTGSVTYTANDSTLQVSATGLVTARYATNGTTSQVIATLTAQGVTQADTAFFQVTDTVPTYPLATFSIQPRPDGIDSAKVAVDASFEIRHIPVYALDTQRDTLCNVNGCALVVAWSSSDPTVAAIDQSGKVTANVVGQVTFYATTLAYGVMKRDSLPFVVGYPILPFTNIITLLSRASVGSQPSVVSFYPSTLTVGVGGIVLFGIPGVKFPLVDVVFDDSTAIQGAFGGPGGNMPADTTLTLVQRVRKFPVAGTYTYHSRLYGTSGVVIAK